MEELFARVFKKRHFFKIRFLYLWFILLSQILCTPSKLTKEYWTLIYIKSSFRLAQLLKIIYGATFYWDTE